MFGSVALTTHAVEDYAPIAGREAIDELRELAAPLRGARVLHLSSPHASGAVRSLLQVKVPLLVDLGLQAYWQQVRVPDEYQEVDKTLRRALSGYSVDWPEGIEEAWWQFNVANAYSFDEEFDIVTVHHTGSVGLYAAVRHVRGQDPAGVWIWDSHRDYRAALPQAWEMIKAHAGNFHVSLYDYGLFMRDDAPANLRVVVPPGIDPLGPRARPVSPEVREDILRQRGLDTSRPMIAQIILNMRQDDPTRVLETFERVRQRHPEMQMVVVDLGRDGAEASADIHRLRELSQDLDGFTLLTEVDRVGNVELSALRDQSAVLLHQGFPRGISLELLEEMWQGRPIVSSRSSVAQAVLEDRRTALLADSPAEQADAVCWLLDNPDEARRMGEAAREVVASGYLVTHHLAAELRLLRKVLNRNGDASTSSDRTTR